MPIAAAAVLLSSCATTSLSPAATLASAEPSPQLAERLATQIRRCWFAPTGRFRTPLGVESRLRSDRTATISVHVIQPLGQPPVPLIVVDIVPRDGSSEVRISMAGPDCWQCRQHDVEGDVRRWIDGGATCG